MKKLVLTIGLVLSSLSHAKCVTIFYDRVPAASPDYRYGRETAMFLQNLLGHFPHLQQYIVPIESYKAGTLDKCQTNFYLGSYFDNQYPEAFHEDLMTTKSTVVWAGYNIWRLGEERLKTLGNIRYKGIAQLEFDGTDAKKPPGWFKYYDYLGETFTKYGAYNADGVFMAASDIILTDNTAPNDSHVVAWARHSVKPEKTPYIIHKGNFWYVADTPFSFLAEGDRYLIFADVLFDMLKEKSRHQGKKPALVRFEDIHPQLPLWQVQAMFDAAKKVGAKYAISMIPIFRDPYGAVTSDPAQQNVKISDRPEFVAMLKKAEQNGGTVIMHGVTHQNDDHKNPSGASGFDFEFWDSVSNKSVVGDSVSFTVNRLEQGVTELEYAGLKPAAWLTPHYEASPLDNALFAQLFSWNIGRLWYTPFQKKQPKAFPAALTFDNSGKEMNGKRLPYLEGMELTYDPKAELAGQFFPYEIYGDAYGQRILPEDGGYVKLATGSEQEAVTFDDILKTMKRNKKLRDVWASFFLHPYLVGDRRHGGPGLYQGDAHEIERVLREIKLMGYDFVDVRDFTTKHKTEIRPEPIESLP